MALMAAEGKSTGSGFGIRTPPLLEYLQGILRGYSDGQVLKELLQNAEDAGATEVKFLYDENQYGIDRLLNPRLKDFQGPALCSWNNAVFTEQDWKGIQTPSQSGKKNNVLKVGRFGIGFSSVYHLTDEELFQKLKFLPWIGVAIPMFQQDVSIGRTFCFLPLPPGEESKSGLPVMSTASLERVFPGTATHLLRYLLKTAVLQNISRSSPHPTDDGEFVSLLKIRLNLTLSSWVLQHVHKSSPKYAGQFPTKCENADPAGLCNFPTMLSSDSWKQFRYLSADDIIACSKQRFRNGGLMMLMK
ncbi:putative sacsin-like [Apostichopus japonicus]|uniref:Putative sacsin-like n=1 Tax=Stichopus japonicus TaxID=307972 RepID=A0A2G8JMK4_STIJA|nr:putative sacsin-like [Apostichopus japonicus]